MLRLYTRRLNRLNKFWQYKLLLPKVIFQGGITGTKFKLKDKKP